MFKSVSKNKLTSKKHFNPCTIANSADINSHNNDCQVSEITTYIFCIIIIAHAIKGMHDKCGAGGIAKPFGSKSTDSLRSLLNLKNH